MDSYLYHLHALSALHVGAGQGTGVIDLPIARERASQLPYVPGSGIKGVLREHRRPVLPSNPHQAAAWLAAYGPEQDSTNGAGFQGALAIGDALLLCLPVRSLGGGFAWATCPTQLLRYQRDAQALPMQPRLKVPITVPIVPAESALLGEAQSSLKIGTAPDEQIALEEFLLKPLSDPPQVACAAEWAGFIALQVFRDAAWQAMFRSRFVIMNDAEFDFLAETATEVRARIRIDHDKGITANKALWYEENLPAETILWGVLAAHASRDGKKSAASAMLDEVPGPEARVQLGGKATVGRGMARVLWGKP